MKLTLDVKSLNEDFFDNTRMLGITASVKNYLFCWQLNQILGFRFRLNPDIEIQLQRKKRSYFFRVYEYREKTSALTHFLYHNYYDGEYLLPEFKHMDFLWLMKGEIVDDLQCSQLTGRVKTISGVQMVTELTLEKIKSKGNLVF